MKFSFGFIAKYDGKRPCARCGREIVAGQRIEGQRGLGYSHWACECETLEELLAMWEKHPIVVVRANPWVERHKQMEYSGCGDGYTRTKAAEIVEWEHLCGHPPFACECGGIAWYRATSSTFKCSSCDKNYFCEGDPFPDREAA